MKIVIVGGGSSYTPELVAGFIEHYQTLPLSELYLMDINATRLETLAGLSQRMFKHASLPVKVTAGANLQPALENAAFVNCLIRVGGMEARILDEKIPLKYGVIGQETTGPGGMMKALRTIPRVLEIAAGMQRACPDAWLINYANPSGIIAEALGKYGGVRFVGLCSGPKGWIETILHRMGASPERANVDWIGLNHLGFAIRVWVDGMDCTNQAIEAAAQEWSVDGEWMRTLGAIPASYLRYYYHTEKVVKELQQPGRKTRGEQVKEIEAELLQQYANPDLHEKPELLKQRGGGGYADVAIAAMESIYHNRGERQIIQALNQGAVDGIPADASVELACLVDRAGTHPIRIGEIPLPIRGLIQAVKAYESLTIQAAVEGSPRIAMQALMAHPLTPSWETAKPLLAELLQANREWIPWV